MHSVLTPTYTVTARRAQARAAEFEYVVALMDREAIRSSATYPTWEAAHEVGRAHAHRLSGPEHLWIGSAPPSTPAGEVAA